jgi:hypothetical protein
MAGTTTYFGISYPTNTDYVKDGANAIQTVASGFDSAVAIPTYNAQVGTTYTFALTDIGKTVTASNASAQTYTIPPTASVTWPTATTLNVINLGAGVVTFAAGAGVTVNNTAGTLSQYQSAALIRTALNTWSVVPFAGGAAPLTDSAISSTTGSPATNSYTLSSVNYKSYAFTGSGSITFSKAGLIDVLVVAAGGTQRAASFGGGAGGLLTQTNFYVPAGAATVTIGASVTSGRGNDSQFLNLTCAGGGNGGTSGVDVGSVGGSGGGGSGATVSCRILGQGNIGANNGTNGAGGGSGGAASSGTGGVGTGNTFRTGASVTYATGGSNSGGAGGANTGDGASGTSSGTASGSGIVVIRVLA